MHLRAYQDVKKDKQFQKNIYKSSTNCKEIWDKNSLMTPKLLITVTSVHPTEESCLGSDVGMALDAPLI